MIPTAEDKAQTTKIMAQFNQLRYSSPIPPPEILAQYESLSPGLVERIVVMAEKQLHQRHEIDNKKLNADIKHIERRDFEATKGQIIGAIISASVVGMGYYAIYIGSPVSAAIISGLGLGGIVTAIILGRTKDHK